MTKFWPFWTHKIHKNWAINMKFSHNVENFKSIKVYFFSFPIWGHLPPKSAKNCKKILNMRILKKVENKKFLLLKSGNWKWCLFFDWTKTVENPQKSAQQFWVWRPLFEIFKINEIFEIFKIFEAMLRLRMLKLSNAKAKQC